MEHDLTAAEKARNNIPVPKGLPLVGNILDLQDEVPFRGVERLLDIYGPIIKLNILGRERIVVGDVALMDELSDEKRFWKTPGDALASLKSKNGPNQARGLFSAPSEDVMDWQIAHRVLIPAFGPLAIQDMFGEMHDIASQLVLKWARMGPQYRIPVTSDFTRLTLDTIALCAMDYRFNSFYQGEMHRFVKAMNVSLQDSSDRLKLGQMLRKTLPWDHSTEHVEHERAYMREVAHELVRIRREHPTDKKDLLNAMVNGNDAKTGQKMSDALIGANMITFLIAGHETTSGLLSFAMLNLLKNPATYFKAQKEVDSVLGRNKLMPSHLKDLHYIDAVLRETLRLTPTAPGFNRSIRDDNPNDVEFLMGGRYAIRRDDQVLILLPRVQQDPKVYGTNSKQFEPERMLDDHFQQLPKGAWKPFGTGLRACIGRAFAWQEAQMALALLLQNFNFTLDDPNYEMKIKQTLTIKPEGFYMRATLRVGVTAMSLQNSLTSTSDEVDYAARNGLKRTNMATLSEGVKMMTILYGSNTGTCQSLAQRLSVTACRHGFHAEIKEMNDAIGTLPWEHPVVVITASYEGQPPDNAGQFVAWLDAMTSESELEGVQYAVFGCGHSDWRTTFQRVPILCDESLEANGATKLCERGLADAAEGDIYSHFDAWTDHVFWPAISPTSTVDHAIPAGLDIQMSTQDRSSYLRQDVRTGTVTDARSLVASGQPDKRHLEVKLSEGVVYETGDYLAILPLNPDESISRVMRRYHLSRDATINITAGAATFLPTDVTLSVVDLLKGFVEIGQTITKKELQTCIAATRDLQDISSLRKYTDEQGFSTIVDSHISLLDLLDRHPSIDLPFSTFLGMLPPLRPRHYSISSSPLSDPTTCTITYAVINETAKSGLGRYIGVTSSYLSSLRPGDDILVSVRKTNKFFHLPADPETTPILLFGAGTGIAPFRGFLQERASQRTAGRELAPAIMFIGCRSYTKDRLYAEEIDAWAREGVVDVRYSFSREQQLSEGCKYIQDRLVRDQEDVLRLWRQGAKVFTCGGPQVSEGIATAAKEILVHSQREQGREMNEQQADDWFRERRNERFVVDVFA